MSSFKFLTHLIVIYSLAFIFFLILVFIKTLYLSPQNVASNDFSHFYTSAVMLRNGHGRDLYNRSIFVYYQAQVSAPYPYPRLIFRSPPLLSLIILPLAFFPYFQAFYIHLYLSLLMLVVFCILIRQLFPAVTNFPFWFLFPFSFLPSIHALAQGQTSILFLLIVTAIVHLLLNRRFFVSGLLFSLLLIKPHVFLVLGLFIILSVSKKTFLKGIVLGSFLILLISVFISGLPNLLNYPHFLISTENVVYGTYLNKYAGLNSFFQSFLPQNISNILTVFFLINFLILFVRRLPKLDILDRFCVSILFALPLLFHSPIYEYTLVLIPLFRLLSMAVSAKNGLKYLVLFSVFFTSFVLSFVDNMQVVLPLFSLALGLFFLCSTEPAPIPKSYRLPISSKLY